MDREALVIIGAAFFVLGLVLIFVWNPITPVLERMSDRIYYWRHPIAHFMDDAHAQSIPIPNAEVLASSRNPADWTRSGQRRRADEFRNIYGVRLLSAGEQKALLTERRRRKAEGIIQLTR